MTEEYKFLSEHLKDYIKNQKRQTLDGLLIDRDEASTKALRYTYNALNELEKFLNDKLEEIKKWD